jgi:hypothetical protein
MTEKRGLDPNIDREVETTLACYNLSPALEPGPWFDAGLERRLQVSESDGLLARPRIHRAVLVVLCTLVLANLFTLLAPFTGFLKTNSQRQVFEALIRQYTIVQMVSPDVTATE